MNVTERFLNYVAIPTGSSETSGLHPSTPRQMNLIHFLEREMHEIGLTDIHIDAGGNIIGTLPATSSTPVPIVAMIAHVDTSPDAPCEPIHPAVVHYEGGEIVLASGKILSPVQFPSLPEQIGKDLIVTDGLTLLGADDKAGVAEIMSAVEVLQEPGFRHGEVRIVFTTDEETGDGVDGLDVDALACEYAYTVDGGALGELEYENFNAASAVVTINGIGIHTGDAKDKMINAATAAMRFHSYLPKDAVPEKTALYEGFLHLHSMQGDVNRAVLAYLVRDHDRLKFEEKKQQLRSAAAEINRIYGNGTADVVITDTYYNMEEKIRPHMHLVERAKKAFSDNGITPVCQPIRGGTDGARLSYMGLPCPNLSTGGFNFHGVYEYIPIQSMETMVRVLVSLLCGFAES